MSPTDEEIYSLLSIFSTFFKILDGGNHLMCATFDELARWLRGIGFRVDSPTRAEASAPWIVLCISPKAENLEILATMIGIHQGACTGVGLVCLLGDSDTSGISITPRYLWDGSNPDPEGIATFQSWRQCVLNLNEA